MAGSAPIRCFRTGSIYGIREPDSEHPATEQGWFAQRARRFSRDLLAKLEGGETLRLRVEEGFFELVCESPKAGRHHLKVTPDGASEELRYGVAGQLFDPAASDLLRTDAVRRRIAELPEDLAKLISGFLKTEMIAELPPDQRHGPLVHRPSKAGLVDFLVFTRMDGLAEDEPFVATPYDNASQPLAEALDAMKIVIDLGEATWKPMDALKQIRANIDQTIRRKFEERAKLVGDQRTAVIQEIVDWYKVMRLVGRCSASCNYPDRYPVPVEEMKARISEAESSAPTQRSPESTQGEMPVRTALFDPDLVERNEGGPIVTRRLSASVRSFASPKRAYLVWSEGPDKGRIYDIVEKPTEDQLAALPSPEEARAEINRLLRAYDASTEYHPPEWRALIEYLEKLYHGGSEHIGLKRARLFDLGGKGAQYDEILRPLEESFVQWLQQTAHAQGLEHAGQLKHPSHWGFGDYREQWCTGLEEPAKRKLDTPGPLTMIHYSSLFALPGMVQLGGLAPARVFQSLGVPKLTGEGPGSAYTPHSLSFTSQRGGYAAPLVTTWGTADLFELPIAFALDREAAEEIPFRSGTMADEKTTGYLPMDQIPYVYVPHFMVDEIRALFEAHGFKKTEVRPFV